MGLLWFEVFCFLFFFLFLVLRSETVTRNSEGCECIKMRVQRNVSSMKRNVLLKQSELFCIKLFFKYEN